MNYKKIKFNGSTFPIREFKIHSNNLSDDVVEKFRIELNGIKYYNQAKSAANGYRSGIDIFDENNDIMIRLKNGIIRSVCMIETNTEINNETTTEIVIIPKEGKILELDIYPDQK